MTVFKTGDYSVFNRMSVLQLRELVDWRIRFEDQKHKMAEEEAQKREAQAHKRQHFSARSYSKK